MTNVPSSLKAGAITFDLRSSGQLERRYVMKDCETDRFPDGFDVPGQPGNVRRVAPDPCIFPISGKNNWPQTDFCWFPERWQWYQVHGMAMAKYGKFWADLTLAERSLVVTAFKGLTGSDKIFNNRQGTDQYNCYPSATGRDPEIRGNDPKWESIFVGGQEYSFYPAVTNDDGWAMRQVYSFYSYENPPPVSYDMLEDPRWQICKIINQDCTFQKFPQLQGVDVPALILTNGPRYYPDRYTKAV
jgi:hypothetical protein